MNHKLQLMLLLMIGIVLFVMVKQIKAKKLLLQYTLSWLTLLFVLLIFILFPDLLSSVSNLLGIAVPVNTVFFLGFCFSLIIIFGLTKAVSKMSEQIKDLTQKIALIDKEDRFNSDK